MKLIFKFTLFSSNPYVMFAFIYNFVLDIGEIWTRLFDHRPFLNGEIRFFLQEFEVKHKNKN